MCCQGSKMTDQSVDLVGCSASNFAGAAHSPDSGAKAVASAVSLEPREYSSSTTHLAALVPEPFSTPKPRHLAHCVHYRVHPVVYPGCHRAQHVLAPHDGIRRVWTCLYVVPSAFISRYECSGLLCDKLLPLLWDYPACASVSNVLRAPTSGECVIFLV